MVSNNDSTFDFIMEGEMLSIEFKGVDYIFPSRVIGKLDHWLVVAKDPALETFSDQIRPGSRLTMRFVSGGSYCQTDAHLKRILADDTAALVIERPGRIERIERRTQPRWACHFSARMELRRETEVVITNINAKGCRLRWPEVPDERSSVFEGDRVHLEASIPGCPRPVLIRGEVRNLSSSDGYVEAGILFDGPPRELPEIIERVKQAQNNE